MGGQRGKFFVPTPVIRHSDPIRYLDVNVCCPLQLYLNALQGVTDVLCEACSALGWKKPTRIQEEALPLAFEGSRCTLCYLHLFQLEQG